MTPNSISNAAADNAIPANIHPNVHKVRIYTKPVAPCKAHLGWSHLLVEDVQSIFTELELGYFECVFLTEERLIRHNPILAGFFQNGGVYPYSEEYFDIDFLIELTDADITQIKGSAPKPMQ
jgi:hypothetical protein